MSAPVPRQELIHVHPDAGEIGRVFAPALGLVSDSEAFFATIEPVDGGAWAPWRAAARADYLAWTSHTAVAGGLDLAEVVAQAARRLDGRAIWVNDAGNFSAWVSRMREPTGTGAVKRTLFDP